ncbi:MAG TPA: tetratricopeptide repeat protein [Anaerolineae bacterium]
MTVEEMERRFFELKGKLDVGAITDPEFKTEAEKLKFQDADGRWWMLGAQSGKWYSFDGTRWLPGKRPVEPPPPPPPPPATAPVALEPPPVPAPSAAQEIALAPAPSTMEPIVIEMPPVPVPQAAPLPSQALYETEPAATVTPPAPAPQPLPEHVAQPSAAPSVSPQPEHISRAPAMAPPPQHLRRTSPDSAFKLPVSGPVIIVAAAVFALVAVLCMWLAVDNFVPGKPISSFFAGLTGSKSTAALTPTPAAGQSAAPREMNALVAMGDQLLLQSNIDSAITQYQNAAQNTPASPIPFTRWSRALAFQGQMQDALDKARGAVQRAPDDAEANAQLTRALAWNGQGNDAIAAGEKAIQLDPKNANAHAFLAEAYLLARRASDAQGQAQTALQLAPQSAEAYRAQAWVLTIQGQKNTALDAWRQTVALEPDFYFRHFELGEVLRVYFSSPADAIPEYRKSISLYGAYTPAISRLGMALIDTNQAEDAIAQFQRAVTLDPNNADGYAYLGVAYGKANQCSAAIPYFEQAIKLDPNNSLAQRGLADCKSGKAPSAPVGTPLPVPLPPPTLVPSP